MSDLITAMFIFIFGILVFTIIAVIPVLLIWNFVLVGIFTLPVITFWQALWITLFCQILFKSSFTTNNNN